MRSKLTRRDFNFAALGGAAILTGGRNTPFSLLAASSAGPNLAEGADVRRVGVRKNGSYWGDGAEHIDLLSGNLSFFQPLVAAVSRNLKLAFALSYNSQIWRSDASGLQQLGMNVGFGYGWHLQAGSIAPVSADGKTISGYTFITGNGTEYPMTLSGGLWTTSQGKYLMFDPSSSTLYLSNGVTWAMGCVSAATEADAGSLYPTLAQDANGNQITITPGGMDKRMKELAFGVHGDIPDGLIFRVSSIDLLTHRDPA